MKQQLSPTWILFASGNSVKVELSLYDPAAERSRPIEAYMVSDIGCDLSRSASRAAEAIYAIAHTAKIAPPPTVVGYDLQGLGSGSHIAGQSSGLALALALAKKFWPDSDPGPIAATGEISNSSNGGPLHKIAEIEAKGKAVLTLLPDGGYFFYPKDNDTEISKSLRQSWHEKGIKTRAVSSVSEALASFIPAIAGKPVLEPELAASVTDPQKGCHPTHLLLAALILVSVIAAGLLYTLQQPDHKLKSLTTQSVPSVKETTNPLGKVNQVSHKAETDIPPEPFKKDLAPSQKMDQLPLKTALKTGPTNAAKQPSSPTAAVKTKAQTSLNQNFPEITLTGNSGLADRLARRTSARLKAFLDSDKSFMKQLQSVDGRIEMIEIRERWNPQTDSLSSTVTAAFNGRTTLKNGALRKVNLEPITVSGNGPMRQQLTHAATLMVDRITKKLYLVGNLKREKQSVPMKPANNADKGFE